MVKVNSKSQKGRSMVEMLGVLAIIGMLSVGSVYGYGVAMKKHKANEALHKASMLATTVSAYAMSNDGNLPSSITDFANLGYETSVTDDGTQFKLTMKGVGYDVCKQMESSMGGMVRNVTCVEGSDDAVITYYKNLATTSEEGERSPTGGSVEVNPCDACEEDQECVDNICIKSKTTDGTCAKNSDCDDWCDENGSGTPCYCYIDADSFEDDSSYYNFRGECRLAKKDTSVTGPYIASYSYVTWWAAENWCKAHGDTLATLSDLGLTLGEDNEESWTELKKYVPNSAYWLADGAVKDEDGNYIIGTNNSLHAFYVITVISEIDALSRDHTHPVALCK